MNQFPSPEAQKSASGAHCLPLRGRWQRRVTPAADGRGSPRRSVSPVPIGEELAPPADVCACPTSGRVIPAPTQRPCLPCKGRWQRVCELTEGFPRGAAMGAGKNFSESPETFSPCRTLYGQKKGKSVPRSRTQRTVPCVSRKRVTFAAFDGIGK